jgi:hypothetical protein
VSDLQSIFAEDPLSYTIDGGQLKTIIEEMRKRRGQFNMGNLKAGNLKPVSEKQKAILSIADQLDL